MSRASTIRLWDISVHVIRIRVDGDAPICDSCCLLLRWSGVELATRVVAQTSTEVGTRARGGGLRQLCLSGQLAVQLGTVD
jgi:hypothetical protein